MVVGGRGHPRAGFSLVELLMALLLFQVGLVGVAGTFLVAQRTLSRSQLVMRGTLAAMRVGDSVLAVGGPPSGLVEERWGRLSWRTDSDGGLQLASTGAEVNDTLFSLTIWPEPESLSVPGDSLAGPRAPIP